MEIIEVWRGHIKVKFIEKIATIYGEGFLPSDSPTHVDYVIYSNSLKHWDKPFDSEMIPSEIKSEIIEFIKIYFKSRAKKLEIE